MPETGPTEFYAPQSGGTVIGDSQDNLLQGGAGMDHLDGEAGSDTLDGGDGDDLLTGGSDASSDLLIGGAGFDRFEIRLDYDYDSMSYLSFGQDVIADFGDGDMLDLISSYGGDPVTLQVSYSATDTLLTLGAGTSYESSVLLHNYIVPDWELPFDGLLNGHLSLVGNADGIVSDDLLLGATDLPDYLYGGAGNDTLEGMGGGDNLAGGSGNDSLSAIGSSQPGVINHLFGDSGDDTLQGGAEDDMLFGGDDQDLLQGGAGMDHLDGEAGSDTLDGGDGDDLLTGGSDASSDLLIGGAGFDRFEIRLDYDYDSMSYLSFGQDVIADFGDGDMLDLISSYGGDPVTLQVSYSATDTLLTLGAGTSYESSVLLHNYIVPDWELPFDGLLNGHLSLVGNADGIVSDDLLLGATDLPDYLYGGAGNDTLEGMGGGDNLAGGSGNDSLSAIGSSQPGVINHLFGDSGDDTLQGGAEDDMLFGGDDQDLLQGGAGMDHLDGEAGSDTLDGGDGDDLLTGGSDASSDLLIGGAGFDRFEIRLDYDYDSMSYLSFGQDVIADFGDGDMLDLISSYGGDPVTLQVSYSATDTLLTLGAGTSYESSVLLHNYIVPDWELPFDGLLNGHLSLVGNADGIVSDDLLLGATDLPDYLYGGAGNDTLEGMGGGDNLAGGSGNDSLSAIGSSQPGVINHLFGDSGDDTLQGGAEDDMLFGGDDQDLLQGGAGMDHLDGEAGSDTLDGGDGDDLLTGGSDASSDLLIGGAGFDRFEIRLDYDYDSMSYLSFGQDVIADFGDGDMLDLISSYGGDPVTLQVSYSATDTLLTLGAGTSYESSVLLHNYIVPDWELPFDGLLNGHLSLVGNADGIVSDDLLLGATDLPDYLYGGAGNDTLEGMGGGDNLAGGSGNDSLSAIGSSQPGVINHLFGDSGDDTLQGGAEDDMLFGGDDQDLLQGGAGMDHLDGEAGSDTLDGGDGDDLLTGGSDASSDLLIGGAGFDRFEIRLDYDYDSMSYLSFGQDVIADFGDGDMLDLISSYGGDPVTLQVSYSATDTLLTLGAGTSYESSVLLHNYIVPDWELPFDGLLNGHLSLVGNADGIVSDDLLLGATDLPDYLYGGAGNDTLEGMGGGDNLAGGSGNDSLSAIGSSQPGVINHLFGDSGDDTLQGGAEDDMLFGGDDQDLLQGGAGMDHLDGEGGSDTLDGGDGDDLLTGGSDASSDLLIGGAGFDRFEILLDYDYDSMSYLSFGQDVIADFGDGDMLDLMSSYGGGDSVTLQVSYSATDTLLTLGAGTSYESSVLLQNYIVPEGELPFDGLLNGHLSLVGNADGIVSDDLMLGATDLPDDLYGGAGNDTLEGMGGGDNLAGGSGNDSLSAIGSSQPGVINHLFGDSGDDTLQGGAEDDMLFGGDDQDLLQGGAGMDHLDGEAGSDTLDGGDGDDLLTGGSDASSDLLIGGAGFDRFEIRLDYDYDSMSYLSFGQDVIADFGDGDMLDLISSYGGDPVTLQVSYSATDTLLTLGAGTSYESSVLLHNYIVPDWELPFDGLLNGHLSLVGNADGIVSDDLLLGATDLPDYLYGGAGNDTLEGMGGGDNLAGGSGNDSLSAIGSSQPGVINHLFGDSGDDTLQGGAEDDMLFGGDDQDLLQGGAGMDHLDGEAGSDTLDGGDGDDLLTGGSDASSDLLIGGAGFDRFEIRLDYDYDSMSYLSFGQDVIADFGDGDMLDLISSYGGDPVTLQVSYSATDTLLTLGAGTSYESSVLLQNYIVPDWELPFDGLLNGHLSLVGNADGIVSDDLMLGATDLPDDLYGGAGNDTLEGMGGGDNLAGGSGNDSLSAIGSSQPGVINHLFGDSGDDTLQGGDEDDMLFGGEDQDLLMGGAGMDHLDGEAGSDTLDGGAGDDLLTSGSDASSDLLIGGAGFDRFEIRLDYDYDSMSYLSFGQDVIADFGDGDMLDLISSYGGDPVTLQVSYSATDTLLTLGAGTSYESSVLLHNYIVPDWELPFDGLLNGHLSLFGNADGIVSDDLMLGATDLPDYLYGGAGNDTLEGMGGGDNLAGGSGNDSLSAIGSSQPGVINHLFGDSGDDTLQGGDEDDMLFGGEDQDLLMGGAGMDHLDGEAGSDTLDGGAGDDLLTSGSDASSDLLIGGAGFDRFEIRLDYDYDSMSYLSFGQDVIADFGDGDMLDLISSYGGDPVTLQVSYSATDTLLTLGAGTSYESSVLLHNYIVPDWELPFDGLLNGHLSLVGNADGIVSDDLLLGATDLPDYLYGGAGNDTLEGMGGGDNLAGGSGNDSLSAIGSSQPGMINHLFGDSGDDTLQGGDEDDMLFGGDDQDLLQGGAGMDHLDGEAGSDTLDGGDGDDLLTSGSDASSDLLIGGAGFDRFEIRLDYDYDSMSYLSFGQDVIADFGDGDMLDLISSYGGGDPVTLQVSYTATDTLLTLGAGTSYESSVLLQNYIVPEGELPFDGLLNGHLSLVGNADGIVSDDLMLGATDLPDDLYGGAGNDTLEGMGGGDMLYGGSGNDSLSAIGSSQPGMINHLFGDSGDDTLQGGDEDDMLFGGDDQDLLQGGAGMDHLDGEAGSDTLDGGDGDDLLTGGSDASSDLLIGGAGFDRFEFNIETDGIGFTSLGADTIADFSEGDVLDVYGWGLGTLDASYSLQGNDSLILLEAGTTHQSTILVEGYHITQNDWNLYGETLSVNWSDAI